MSNLNYSYEFNKDERKDLKEITSKYYMKPIISRIDELLDSSNPQTFQIAFNYLHDIIRASQKEVESLLDARVKSGEIRNLQQASRSIVGNIFSFSLIYLFLKNKEIANIRKHIFITSKPSTRIEYFPEISTIHIGDQDQQKPDCDLVIYSYDTKNSTKSYPKCIILSLKTSLRERAAQTYK